MQEEAPCTSVLHDSVAANQGLIQPSGGKMQGMLLRIQCTKVNATTHKCQSWC